VPFHDRQDKKLAYPEKSISYIFTIDSVLTYKTTLEIFSLIEKYGVYGI